MLIAEPPSISHSVEKEPWAPQRANLIGRIHHIVPRNSSLRLARLTEAICSQISKPLSPVGQWESSRQDRREKSSQGSRNSHAASSKDPPANMATSISGFPSPVLLSKLLPSLTLWWIFVTISCAETLPEASIFLEDELISPSEALPLLPVSVRGRVTHGATFISLLGRRHGAHTWGSSVTQRRRGESCWCISAGFVKNNSRHYKVCVINMHMWYLWGRAAFKVYFQQDNIFPREVGTTVNHMCGREKPGGYVQYLLPLCLASLSPAPPPSHFINGFCNYW